MPSSASQTKPPALKTRLCSRAFPSTWVNLIRVLLESQEGALELLMGLCILDDAIRQAHITVHTSLPEHPRLLTLAAGNSALLRSIFVAERSTTGRQDDVGMR